LNATDYNPFSPENLARVRAKQLEERQQEAAKAVSVQNNGQRPDAKRLPANTAKVEFLTFDLALLHRLHAAKANSAVYAMVWALSEAWFTTGFHQQHPNPLPLCRVNTAKWQLSRKQKSRALQFLTQIGLVQLDRSDPKKPLVRLAWVPPYPPIV
jgi:hypothetical protein